MKQVRNVEEGARPAKHMAGKRTVQGSRRTREGPRNRGLQLCKDFSRSGMAAGKDNGAAMIIENKQLDVKRVLGKDFRPPLCPLQDSHASAVQGLFNACRDRLTQASQPVDIHVKQGGSAVVLVDEGEGRAGHDGSGVHPETQGNPFREPGLPASQFAHEADHVALHEKTSYLLPELNRMLIRFRRDGESLFFQRPDEKSFAERAREADAGLVPWTAA